MQDESSQARQDKYHQVVAHCTCANLRKTARVITQLYDDFLQPSGLLGTQFRLLGAVAAKGSIAVTPLAELLEVDPTTLARNLRPLERDGLIEIAPGEDRRTRVVSITQQGQRALARALPLWEEAQAFVISRLGEERWRAMLGDWSDLVSLVRS